MKKIILLTVFVFGAVVAYIYLSSIGLKFNNAFVSGGSQNNKSASEGSPHPLAIESLRKREYPGSDIVIEQELPDGSNYRQYIASYKSDGLKIFGLLTIPKGNKPVGGWPAIIFNHGFIQPNQYKTTERYVEYLDGFAKNGYVVFKSDYRGHGNSEGIADGNYYSPGYLIDVLNAKESIKKLPEVNPEKIGMWGHSMGGNIVMKSLVIADDIKAAVIWAGVVGSYDDILNNWDKAKEWMQSEEYQKQGSSGQSFIKKFGDIAENPSFWSSIDPYSFIDKINTPVQLHHGTGDVHVPLLFSENFRKVLENNGKNVELYVYDGADHNLSGDSFTTAMDRSILFFDKYLK